LEELLEKEPVEEPELVEDVAWDNAVMAACLPVILSYKNMMPLCAVKTVTIKKAGMISETTRSTKLNALLDREAPVMTRMKTQCSMKADDPINVMWKICNEGLVTLKSHTRGEYRRAPFELFSSTSLFEHC
jgi:hypothetical protein